MANPFETQVLNPFQALLYGQQSYDSGVKRSQENAKRSALANLLQGGGASDPNAVANTLLSSGDTSGAATYANLAQTIEQRKAQAERDARDFKFRQDEAQRTQRNADRSYGLQAEALKRGDVPAQVRIVQAAGLDPASPEGRKALFPRTDTPLSATDKKYITSAEDELPNIQGTIDALTLAKDLNTKTFTGLTAGARGYLGTAVPGGSYLVDKDAAMATSEFGKVMSGEAIKTMADTLKGATTDFELKKFETMLADPTTPPEIRGRVIDRMSTLAQRQKAIKERRVNDLRGGDYFKPQGQAASQPAQPGGIAEGATATNPQTGAKIMFRNGQWVPAQ